MPMGRPSLYSVEIVNEICERLSNGQSLVSICKSENMPNISTVFDWLSDPEKKDFTDKYARAREAQADYLAEETMEISDDGSNDWMERNDPNNPGWVANGEHIQRSRLRVDARKWYAGKVAPKKYGDKLELSGDKENPLNHKITVGDELAEIMTLEQLEKVKERVLAKTNAG